MLLAIILVLLLLSSSILIYHVFSEDSMQVNQGDEKRDTADDVMNEIDESLILEDDEVEIGEMV